MRYYQNNMKNDIPTSQKHLLLKIDRHIRKQFSHFLLLFIFIQNSSNKLYKFLGFNTDIFNFLVNLISKYEAY